jgi:hypothetical protein
MTDATQLQQAYDLIEADKLDEARAILEPIVAEEKDNADAWWLYAHAVNEPDIARGALQNVLRIDPNYPEANSLLTMLEQEVASGAPQVSLTQPPLRTIKPLGSAVSTPAPAVQTADEEVPDFSSEGDMDFDDKLPDGGEEPKRKFPIPMPILAVAAVIGVIICGLILAALLNPPTPPPTDTPETSVAMTTDEVVETIEGQSVSETPEGNSEPTVESQETAPAAEGQTAPTAAGDDPTAPTQEGSVDVTSTPEDSRTDTEGEIPTPEDAAAPAETDTAAEVATAGVNERLIEALGDYTLPVEPFETITTDLGTTFIATICSTPEELRTTAIGAMNVIANNGRLLNNVDAVGVRIVDCETNTTLRAIAVEMKDALDFSMGTLNENDFQSQWQPIE